MTKVKKIVPDTSAIINGKISEMIENGELKSAEIIIPEMVLDELQAQANRGLEIGFIGLDEIKKLREFSEKKKGITVSIVGRRPTEEEIRLAKKGRIDALIRDVAERNNAILCTADLVQAEVARANGIDVLFIEKKVKKFPFEKYLDKSTMSLHFKDGARPFAKRGKPGKFKLVVLEDRPWSENEIKKMAEDIIYIARQKRGQFEIHRPGVDVIQVGEYRIAITTPPFSSGYEITVVRPIVKLTIEDYKPSKKLMDRIEKKAEGIIIAGSPGSGKTSFASSLAEFYLRKGKIVKTLESPRDLQVPPEINQYGSLGGSMVNSADVLLLVRPDYTIFDEMRNTSDFKVFVDMRLSGIGMVGVVHASDPISAIQRFIGRTELGMIPHIIDTVIFIKAGKIEKIYYLDLKVRVPSGMTEEDLARPLVEIRDFETDKLEYEIYTYGEENVVVPVEERQTTPVEELAKKKIIEELVKYDKSAEVEISGGRAIVKVSNKVIPRLIGKNGKNIEKIEKRLGIKIDVQPKVKTLGNEIEFEIGETGAYVILSFDKKYVGKNANIYVDGEYLFTATVGKNKEIRISKNSVLGKKLIDYIAMKKDIKVFV
ncbi:MAG: Flp pilus assembly complex ATPase component TadA [Candidatus Aenigmarchaeota archaeon]|nr:Flp pilus assembly complex ATPase component TadA [Candidatus Aenigmarchaeota archaeon]